MRRRGGEGRGGGRKSVMSTEKPLLGFLARTKRKKKENTQNHVPACTQTHMELLEGFFFSEGSEKQGEKVGKKVLEWSRK